MIVDVQGHSVHLERSGSGPPALFVHGVPDSAELWHDVIAGVQDRYACHAADFMGINRSQANLHFNYSFNGCADWVEALVQAAGIADPVTLIVHDWGGLIGLAWACRYPQRIARIVIINTVFTPEYRWHFWARVWRTPVLGELAMLLMNRVLFYFEIRRGSRRLTREQIARVWAGAPSKPSSRAVILKLYRSADPKMLAGWPEHLRALAGRVPVDVIWGENDPYIPGWVATTFFARSVERIPDCGHWVPMEAPERVIAVLRSDD